MKKKKFLIEILWSVAIIISISACSYSNDIWDEDYVPTESDIAEVLKRVYTEWGTSKEIVRRYMDGYQLIESSDESILQFNAKKIPVTIAYQFSSDKLCAAVIMAQKGEEKIDIKNTLNDFNYVGESSSNDIYSNIDKNIFAVAYESVDNEENYHVIGFTPLFPKTENVNGKECTDLGLSVKWATCNVGARSPEEHGGYFAWGEIEEKDNYDRDTYKYYSGSTYENIGDNLCGTQYDVAQAVLGNPWMMPTKENMDELRTKCDWVWTAENGVKGYKVFGENGNYIFLPAVGYKTTYLKNGGTNGYYMTATSYLTSYAHDLEFSNSSIRSSSSLVRWAGVCVRAVLTNY